MDNCAAAASDIPDGLTLVKVNTIADAATSLQKIKSGDTAALPACAPS